MSEEVTREDSSKAKPTEAPPLPPRNDQIGETLPQEESADIPTDLGREKYQADVDFEDPSKTSLETENGCVGGILVASCVELAQAGQNCQQELIKCEDENAYAVAVGCISLTFCLCYFLCLYFKPGSIPKFTQCLSLFLMLWWGVGTIVLTFDAPFNTTGNGYFACWGAALLSILYCQLSVEKFKTFGASMSNAFSGTEERKVLSLIMILSYVEAFAALLLWDEVNLDGTSTEKQSRQETWAFACGIVAGGLATLYLLLKTMRPNMLGPRILRYFSWFLVPWWMFGAGVATFDEPFPTTGNGYFCAWGAFVSSCYLAYIATLTVSA